MNAEELRARQAPLKERYRQDPSLARVVSEATGDYRDPGITATIDGWAGPAAPGSILRPAETDPMRARRIS